LKSNLAGPGGIAQTSLNVERHETGNCARAFSSLQDVVRIMIAQTKQWKHALDELWSAPVLDHIEAAKVVAEIVRHSVDPALGEAAAQALPSLRAAALSRAEGRTKQIASRRLGAIRDMLHALDAPRFGKRQSGGEALSPQDRYRIILGLPLGRRLFGPEIKEAFKRAAKNVHPDAGGSERDFIELKAARDELIRAL
jgi:hypothetical protein